MPVDLSTTPIETAVEQIVVAAADARPGLVALTGRAARNVVPWGDAGAATPPVVAFDLKACPQIGARTFRVTLGVAGFAPPTQESLARAMRDEVIAALGALGLAAVAAPLGPIDGVPFGAPQIEIVVDVPREGEAPPLARADATLTLTLWL